MDRDRRLKASLTLYFKEATTAIQTQNVDSDTPIGSQDSTNALCHAVEAAFLHGLKGTSSDKNFWSLLRKYTHAGTVSLITDLTQISTDIGRCRAWVRQTINEFALESYIGLVLADQLTLRNYYRQSAYLRDVEHTAAMQTYLQALSNFTFELSVNSTVLNQWTTSSLVLSGIMQAGLLHRPANSVASLARGSMIHSASEARLGSRPGAAQAAAARKRRPARMAPIASAEGQSDTGLVSASAPQGHYVSAAVSYDSLQLTRNDIDAIRELAASAGGAVGGEGGAGEAEGSGSTPSSLVSHPDFTDARQDLYSIVYGLTPDSSDAGLDEGSGHRLTNEEQERRFEVIKSNLKNYPLDYDQKINERFAKYDHLGNADLQTVIDSYQTDDDLSITFSSLPASLPMSTEVVQSKSSDGNPHDMTTSDEKLNLGNSLEGKAPDGKAADGKLTDQKSSNEKPSEGKSEDKKQMDKTSPERKSHATKPNDVTSSSENLSSGKTSGDKSLATSAKEPGGVVKKDIQKARDSSPAGPQGATGSASTRPIAPREGSPAQRSTAQEINPGNTRAQLSVTATETSVAKDGSTQATRLVIEDSYSALLTSHIPVGGGRGRRLNPIQDLIDTLPDEPRAVGRGVVGDRGNKSGRGEEENRKDNDDNVGDGANRLLTGCNNSGLMTPDDSSQRDDGLCVLRTEKGLARQCYQCRGCVRPIGMLFGGERLCEFDGSYYCYECHENEQHCIPARIVFNWDFRPYRVCKTSLARLQDFFDKPLLNIDKLNPLLYHHVTLLADVKVLRIRLRYLKSYLFTCRHPSSRDFKIKVEMKLYLCENEHIYSVKDLTQVPSGTLAAKLKKWIEIGVSHVYDCALCSQKGFYCELCEHASKQAKPIYPFETDTTVRCDQCKAVYHRQCKTSLVPCPKCVRRLLRQSAVTTDNPES